MIETAHLSAAAEFKFAGDDAEAGAMAFSGYGAVFGNVDSYGDVIERGAFAAWLADVKAGKQPWPAMLSQHGGWGMSADDVTPVGVWTDLTEDAKGLKVGGKLADTPRGIELYRLMKMDPRPAINGLSIGYIPKEWEPQSKPGDPRRKLKRIDVMEISPVTFPANNRARVGAVKSFARPTNPRELETMLREACGLSAREAKRLVAGGWSAFSRDEADDDAPDIAALLTDAAKTFQPSR